ncbi:HNH endonuclease [Bdellovibrio sp. GT3]|uniref:HNH endonuclease n=1 Tax=Bdellovibrio sp. GT3 TaxID=3136282 RepID=UPI0030F283D4
MNLKTLSLNELDQRIKVLAQKEREILHEVLQAIKEVDSRRSYLNQGFGSLFEYLVRGVGYSEGSAQRRIDAARLIRELPQLADKIQAGEIKLSQISVVQKAVREVAKSKPDIRVSTMEKAELIESLISKSHAQTQHMMAEFFELPVLNSQSLKVQADESVRVEMTLTKEAFDKIKRAQELLSHSLPNQDMGLFLEFLAGKVIKQKTGSSEIYGPGKSQLSAKKAKSIFETAGGATKFSNKRIALLAKDKKRVLSTQSGCQFVDPVTGHKCQSKWKVQIDHKQSLWAGGGNDVMNLQQLCAGHNKLKYRNEAGIRLMGN